MCIRDRFSDEDINATLDELGLLDFAQGGIASLKDGGMLDFGVEKWI